MHCETFRLAGEAAALEPFNAQVRARLAAGPFPPDDATAAALFLVLDEWLTNVIKYAHPGGGGAAHEITVCVCLDAAEFVVDIEDDGVAFDPTAAAAPAVADEVPWEDRPVGGWGLELVRRTVDSVAYRRDESRNKLTPRKRFARAAGG